MMESAAPGLIHPRVALSSPRKAAAQIDALALDAIHIATERPIGLTARWSDALAARRRRQAFSAAAGREPRPAAPHPPFGRPAGD
jgi:hypothetical protein